MGSPTPRLETIASDTYAWMSGTAEWGWSNAGLVVDGGEALMVDTLFDLPATHTMLDAMRAAEPVAMTAVGSLINTHANGDHCHGNELVGAAEIIASTASAREMAELPPGILAGLMEAAVGGDLAPTPLGAYLRNAFGDFDFTGITLTLPSRTFDKRLDLRVGDTVVELYEVGPAHTGGDVIVHVPIRGVVYTGDILFIEGTPLMWAGPVANWIAACDLIDELEADVIVPGHGPLADAAAVDAVRGYLAFIDCEARVRYEGGMTIREAAADIDLGEFGAWGEPERIVANVAALYREYGSEETMDVVALFTAMADFAALPGRR